MEQTTYVAEDNVAEFTGYEGPLMDENYDRNCHVRHPEVRTTPE